MNGLFDDVQFRRAATTAAWLLVAFLAVAIVSALMGLRYIGAGVQAGNTISVSGYGESHTAPDIATFTFSVVSDKPAVAAAQADATTKANATLAYLKSAGIDEKDIQTSGYSVSPQYDYNGGSQVLRGYEARQTTTVKVRDLTKAGDILAGVGQKGATEVSGLSFTFDNPNQGQDEARTNAIADAKAKADELARELGVSVVRVVSFNESVGGNQPRPVYYAKDTAVAQSAGSAPEISPGQNTVSDTVSITYEIR